MTDGLALQGSTGVKSVAIHIETAGTMTAGGTLQVYLWNPVGGTGTGQWNRAPDLDPSAVQALASQAFGAIQIIGPAGRIAVVPVGIGVASVVYMNATY